MSNTRITTKEFYSALLEINPQLQTIGASLASLQEWATGEDGVEKRLIIIGRRIQRMEERHIKEDARRKTFRSMGKGLQVLIYVALSVLSAFVGSTF